MVLVLAVVFVALFCGAFVKSVRSTIFYLLKHLTFKQMLILAAVMLFLCGSFNGLPMPFSLLLGAVQYVIILSTIVLLWWFFFKRWDDSIDSGEYQKFTDKAEQEYQEYKSKKAQVQNRKDKEFSDLVNKRYHEFVDKE